MYSIFYNIVWFWGFLYSVWMRLADDFSEHLVGSIFT
jgi:hypothetical protein